MVVKVKPLEWVQAVDWLGNPTGAWVASSPIGRYVAGMYRDAVFYCERDVSISLGRPSSIDEARAMCEADYERRVMSCLEVTP